MATPSTLEIWACELLRQAWQRQTQAAQVSMDQSMEEPDECPSNWILPEAVAWLEQAPDQPARALAPRLRRLLQEREFINENGDSMIATTTQAANDRDTELLVTVLEQVRRLALARGLWSTAPVTPLMCG